MVLATGLKAQSPTRNLDAHSRNANKLRGGAGNRTRVLQTSTSPSTCVASTQGGVLRGSASPSDRIVTRILPAVVLPCCGHRLGRLLWVHAPAPTEAPRTTGTPSGRLAGDDGEGVIVRSRGCSADFRRVEHRLHAGKSFFPQSKPITPDENLSPP